MKEFELENEQKMFVEFVKDLFWDLKLGFDDIPEENFENDEEFVMPITNCLYNIFNMLVGLCKKHPELFGEEEHKVLNDAAKYFSGEHKIDNYNDGVTTKDYHQHRLAWHYKHFLESRKNGELYQGMKGYNYGYGC